MPYLVGRCPVISSFEHRGRGGEREADTLINEEAWGEWRDGKYSWNIGHHVYHCN